MNHLNLSMTSAAGREATSAHRLLDAAHSSYIAVLKIVHGSFERMATSDVNGVFEAVRRHYGEPRSAEEAITLAQAAADRLIEGSMDRPQPRVDRPPPITPLHPSGLGSASPTTDHHLTAPRLWQSPDEESILRFRPLAPVAETRPAQAAGAGTPPPSDLQARMRRMMDAPPADNQSDQGRPQAPAPATSLPQARACGWRVARNAAQRAGPRRRHPGRSTGAHAGPGR